MCSLACSGLVGGDTPGQAGNARGILGNQLSVLTDIYPLPVRH